jgi:hypothetical protein
MVSGKQWTRWPGQGTWNRTAGAGQLGQDSWDRTVEAGQPGQDRRVRTGHLGTENWDKTAETGRTGQVGLIGNLDRTARI